MSIESGDRPTQTVLPGFETPNVYENLGIPTPTRETKSEEEKPVPQVTSISSEKNTHEESNLKYRGSQAARSSAKYD